MFSLYTRINDIIDEPFTWFLCIHNFGYTHIKSINIPNSTPVIF